MVNFRGVQIFVRYAYLGKIGVARYHKRRKFRGVINFVVFADSTIPGNLIRWV